MLRTLSLVGVIRQGVAELFFFWMDSIIRRAGRVEDRSPRLRSGTNSLDVPEFTRHGDVVGCEFCVEFLGHFLMLAPEHLSPEFEGFRSD